ncbi:unnamed protein product, partial [Cuscuta epithymum]
MPISIQFILPNLSNDYSDTHRRRPTTVFRPLLGCVGRRSSVFSGFGVINSKIVYEVQGMGNGMVKSLLDSGCFYLDCNLSQTKL